MPRPASVTVFGVLNLLYGGLSLCGVAVTIPLLMVEVGQKPVGMLGSESLVYQVWTYFSLAISVPLTIQLLAAGVGLLRMRRWGLTLSLWYAALDLLLTFVGVVFIAIYVAVPLLQGEVAGGPAEIGGAIGGVIGGAFGMIYPALMWYFLSRPHVAAAFAGAGMPFTPEATAGAAIQSMPAAPASDNPYVAPPPASAYYGQPFGADQPADDSVLTSIVPVRNPAALASYYLGVFGLIPCLGLPLAVAAILFGVSGLRAARRLPEAKGQAHAWVGIILGSIVTLLSLVAVVLFGIGIATG